MTPARLGQMRGTDGNGHVTPKEQVADRYRQHRAHVHILQLSALSCHSAPGGRSQTEPELICHQTAGCPLPWHAFRLRKCLSGRREAVVSLGTLINYRVLCPPLPLFLLSQPLAQVRCLDASGRHQRKRQRRSSLLLLTRAECRQASCLPGVGEACTSQRGGTAGYLVTCVSALF